MNKFMLLFLFLIRLLRFGHVFKKASLYATKV